MGDRANWNCKRMSVWVRWLLVAVLTCTASGCWDRVEIEERGFVVGVAVDLPKSKDIEKKEHREAPDKPKGPLRFVLTQQIVVPARLREGGGSNKGGSSGGGGGEAYVNIASEGDTVFGIVREVVSRTSRTPYYEHIKNIIISDAVARSGQFANILDFFVRENEIRRGTKVMIAKGEACEVLSIRPETERLPALYIDSVFNNNRKNARILPREKSRLGDIHEQLLKSQSFVIPQIGGKGREVKLAGAAVFDGATNRMVGFLSEEETEGLNFLTGKIKGGILELPVQNNISVFEMRKVKTKITAHVSNKNHLIFTIHMNVYGNIGESFGNMDFTRPQTMKTLEASTEQQVERLGRKTIYKVQQVYQKDVLGLGNYMRLHHYPVWKQIGPDWEKGQKYFVKSDIRMDVKVSIDTSGAVNHSESQSTE